MNLCQVLDMHRDKFSQPLTIFLNKVVSVKISSNQLYASWRLRVFVSYAVKLQIQFTLL